MQSTNIIEDGSFLGQPMHSFFNKDFCNNDDNIFLQFNYIAPKYLKQGKDSIIQEKSIDPRINKVVENSEIDFNTTRPPEVFQSNVRSNFTSQEISSFYKVLKARQNNDKPVANEVKKWNNLHKRRAKEQQAFQQFVEGFSKSHKEEMYKHTAKLMHLYKKLCKYQGDQLQKDLHNNTFKICSAFPILRANIKNNIEASVKIENIKLLNRKGYIRLWQPIENDTFQEINSNLENLIDFYNKNLSQKPKISYNEIKSQLAAPFGEHEKPRHRFFLPIKTLLMLMISNEYVDMPTEVLFEIRDGASENLKNICFEEPLPAHHCGWHTYNNVVEIGYITYLSKLCEQSWMRIDDETISQISKDAPLITADNQTRVPFQLRTTKNFIKKCNYAGEAVEENLKLNQILIKYHLSNQSTNEEFDILSTLEMAAVLDKNGTEFLGSDSIKLEFKPTFGLEVMTKYQLYQEWLKIFFMSKLFSVDHGICTRICSQNFKKQLEEKLTIRKIENTLMNVYKIDIKVVLSYVYSYLKCLLDLPNGNYMLKLSDTFANKFLVCAPTNEAVPNSTNLHDYLKIVPNNIRFMMGNKFLPISNALVGVLHDSYNITPAMFLPISPSKSSGTFLNPLSFLKIYQSTENKLKKKPKIKVKYNKIPKTKRNLKKQRRKIRQRHEKKKVNEIEQEVQKDIMIDQLLFDI